MTLSHCLWHNPLVCCTFIFFIVTSFPSNPTWSRTNGASPRCWWQLTIYASKFEIQFMPPLKSHYETAYSVNTIWLHQKYVLSPSELMFLNQGWSPNLLECFGAVSWLFTLFWTLSEHLKGCSFWHIWLVMVMFRRRNMGPHFLSKEWHISLFVSELRQFSFIFVHWFCTALPHCGDSVC